MATPIVIGRSTKDTLKLLFQTRMVTVEVGPEKEHFVVHQSVICEKSNYFAKALCGTFQEGITGLVRLPDISPVIFRIFLVWLHHGKLAYVTTDAGIDVDFASLTITDEDLEDKPFHQTDVSQPDDTENDSVVSDDSETERRTFGTTESTVSVNDPEVQTSSSAKSANNTVLLNESKHDEENPESWAFHVFIKLYVFAERFDFRQLRADALDGLATVMDKSWVVPVYGPIQYVYMNKTANSKLRRYLVHRTAYRRTVTESASEFEKYPVEFLAAVLVTNGRRLPVKQLFIAV
ncbi:hypothetical protein D6C81_00644 [Aureobasidium pullulans]|nr:hypothetical protein D6C81_00644 [Aureobasidium pullulans]